MSWFGDVCIIPSNPLEAGGGGQLGLEGERLDAKYNALLGEAAAIKSWTGFDYIFSC